MNATNLKSLFGMKIYHCMVISWFTIAYEALIINHRYIKIKHISNLKF